MAESSDKDEVHLSASERGRARQGGHGKAFVLRIGPRVWGFPRLVGHDPSAAQQEKVRTGQQESIGS
ncbi:MAG: hypothetical protein Q7O66_02680 [Dehalococcoidia bacterium]|nr:hypothetical protein [Dehalococcoidia bacterium]